MKIYLISAMVFFSFISIFSDSWSYPKEKSESEQKFGDITIVKICDATKSQNWPYFEIQVLNKDKLVTTIKNEYFDDIYSSTDNKYFIGVSNSGIPKTAYIIFDNEGNVIKKVQHDKDVLKYTKYSITLVREWYSPDTVNIKFEIEDNKLIDIKATNSSKERISLLKKD